VEREPPPRIPHTPVHAVLRSTLETALDVIVIVLLLMLLAITVEVLWRIGTLIVARETPYAMLVSHIVFVLVLAELYRTLIFYLREHRVSIALIVEVAIVTTLQHLLLSSAQAFDVQRVLGDSLLLLVLGALLAMERLFGRLSGATDTSAH
jgi:uncharacterized membrane protein (DUF373 family)